MKRIFVTILMLVIAGVGSYLMYVKFFQGQISTFEECVRAGYPVAESYPRQCKTPDGRNYIEESSDESIEVEMAGEVVCLPKNGDGPQTLECAMGLKGSDGNNYALKNMSQIDPEYKLFASGKILRVKGYLRSEKPTGPDGNFYNVNGTIEILEAEETNGT